LQQLVEGKGHAAPVHSVAGEQDQVRAEAPDGFYQAQVTGPQVVAQVQVRQLEQPQRRPPAFRPANGVFGYIQLVKFPVGYVRERPGNCTGYPG
jgi:hypothetical protein